LDPTPTMRAAANLLSTLITWSGVTERVASSVLMWRREDLTLTAACWLTMIRV